MQDQYNRTIDYLRVSVTDRCNFRCVYCMPSKGVVRLPHKEILRYEEILRLIRLASCLGVKKIRLTGGEPLVRKGVVDFVRKISGISGIEDLSMTTNGSLLPDLACSLKQAGLNRVNISLDTADPERFASITGRKQQLMATLAGINHALAAGLSPVKINVALTSFFKVEDLRYFIDLVYRYPIHVRFIEYMPIGDCQIEPGPTIEMLKYLLNSAGKGKLFAVPNHTTGSGPARYYQLPAALGLFGFITPLSDHFCYECNRLRLTADGKLKPCLLSNREVDIKTPLRDGADDGELRQLFYQAISMKPSQHSLSNNVEQLDSQRSMSQIGG